MTVSGIKGTFLARRACRVTLLFSAIAMPIGLFWAGFTCAYAQTVILPVPDLQEESAATYPLAYFDSYAPRTALDMVRRVPGFSIRGGNDGARGLGQGGANVLINGARISGKSVSADDALERIPASHVLSIALVDGTSVSIAGLSGQVVNVLTKTGAGAGGFSGTWEWTPELRQTQEPNILRGKASVTGERGKLKYVASLDARAFRGGGNGLETLSLADGSQIESAQERGRSRGQRPEASLALTYAFDADRIANVSAAYGQFNSNSYESSDRVALSSDGDTRAVVYSAYEDERKGELSADYIFPLGPGALKLIGVASFEDSPSAAQSMTTRDAVLDEQVLFYTDALESEQIARAEYSFAPTEGRDWQISVESAFNSLDIENRLFELDGGALTQSVLDDPSVRVEEARREVTLTHSRQLSQALHVQVSLGAESSHISQSGASDVSREFVRPKGFIKASYTVDNSFKIRLESDRRVGQLRFFDFISSIDVSDETETSSNADLVPLQYWNHVAVFEKDFGQGNTALLRLFYEDITDLVDRIPIGDTGDAVGNIDKASSVGAIFKATLKGERWGLPGAQFDLLLINQTSNVKDPLTGQDREISGRNRTRVEADVRHDIDGTPWAYGFGLESFDDAPSFGIEEISRDYFTGPFTGLFLEHKDVFGLKARVNVRNLIGVREGASRYVFDGRRSDAALSYFQMRERDFGRIVRFSLSGSF